NTPPSTDPDTPIVKPVADATNSSTTPISLAPDPSPPPPSRPPIPPNLTQSLVTSSPPLARLQQDLLILTSFAENSTLHWRPPWFDQDAQFSGHFWTLYNPPNVVTELLPHRPHGRLVYTRRMRRAEDAGPKYITSWAQWKRVCELRGVPQDWMSRAMISLMRLGLHRDKEGKLISPPEWPLYPEPQPRAKGRYILSPRVYDSLLPRAFRNLDTAAPVDGRTQAVVVHSNGALEIESREDYFLHDSQWSHFDGKGGYRMDWPYVPDMNVVKDQSRGRRWAHLPWTSEMEESCRRVVRLKVDWGR
ncbi:hypothetical protein BDU57DRAFT_404914, partial [Ampelomyces quisqualis]